MFKYRDMTVPEIIRKNYMQLKYRATWLFYRKKRILKSDIRDVIKKRSNGSEIKLNICCGDKAYPQYINIDIVPREGVDIVMDCPADMHLVPSKIASEIVIEAGLEHFYRYQQEGLLSECHRILADKGRLVLKWIPDFDLIIKEYLKSGDNGNKYFDIQEVYRLVCGAPNVNNSPYQLHKDIFTKSSTRKLLEQHSFKIEDLSDKMVPGEKCLIFFDAVAVKQ